MTRPRGMGRDVPLVFLVLAEAINEAAALPCRFNIFMGVDPRFAIVASDVCSPENVHHAHACPGGAFSGSVVAGGCVAAAVLHGERVRESGGQGLCGPP